jgi:quercetin dioxygenase-like cupin family protein
MDVVHESDEASAEAVDGVHLKLLAGGTEANVQHLRIEPGAVVPEHSHPSEQLGYVASGTFTVHVDGGARTVEPGDSCVLAGEEPHSVENTGGEPAVGVEVFAPPRENPHWRDRARTASALALASTGRASDAVADPLAISPASRPTRITAN